MEWYLKVLLAVAVIGIVAFKIWYVPKWLKKQSEKKAQRAKLMEDDE